MAGTTKRRATIRKSIETVLHDHFSADKLEKFIKKLEEEEGTGKVATFYMQLMEYITPKLARTEVTGHDGEALTVSHVLKQVSSQGGSSELAPIDITPERETERKPAALQHKPADIMPAIPQSQPVTERAAKKPAE